MSHPESKRFNDSEMKPVDILSDAEPRKGKKIQSKSAIEFEELQAESESK